MFETWDETDGHEGKMQRRLEGEKRVCCRAGGS